MLVILNFVIIGFTMVNFFIIFNSFIQVLSNLYVYDFAGPIAKILIFELIIC
jgi:hypothetical protein